VRALVIEDSEPIRRVLKNMMVEIGFEVTEARSGADALGRLRDGGGFDVALVDWGLPDMEGGLFVRTVRSHSEWDALRLIVVGSEAEGASLAAALDDGADEYLLRPFTKDVVADKLAFLGMARP
jgi:two-component system, chemotaxis family, chemotaxis protein CheY